MNISVVYKELENTTKFRNVTNFLDVEANSPTTCNQKIAMIIVIAVMGFWSTLGNLLTIVTILSRHYMNTKTNVFILSLAFSDLFSGLIASPLWVYRRTFGFRTWEIGRFACKLFGFTDEATSYCTAMHIAAFAIWRYIGIKSPQTRMRIKIRRIRTCVCIFWVLALIFGGIPWTFFYEVLDKPQDGNVYAHWPHCSLDFRGNGVQNFIIYYKFSSITFLYLPFLILFITSALIVVELKFNTTYKSKLRQSKERAAIAQLVLIAVSFLFGYVPMTSYMTWTVRVSDKDQMLDYWVHVAAYFSLRASECFNPVAYNIASKKMRKASKEVLIKLLCCGKTSNNLCCPLSSLNKRNKSSLQIPIPLSDSSTGNIKNNRLSIST